MQNWESRFRRYLAGQCLNQDDAAHDLAHTERVVRSAKKLAGKESAEPSVVIPAAWLHDVVVLAKDHPDRSGASRLAADRAVSFLRETGYEPSLLRQIHHAIEAHSFSAGIAPETKEAKIVQDADRLDALGAVGIARCCATGGSLGRGLYQPDDPFCEQRDPDDSRWTLDHFYQKLFTLPGSMQTRSGAAEAQRRLTIMKQFIEQLKQEIS